VRRNRPRFVERAPEFIFQCLASERGDDDLVDLDPGQNTPLDKAVSNRHRDVEVIVDQRRRLALCVFQKRRHRARARDRDPGECRPRSSRASDQSPKDQLSLFAKGVKRAMRDEKSPISPVLLRGK
jgi:hypothetical protein